MTAFTFVRHGESEANAAVIIALVTSPLSALGREQAQKTGAALREKGIVTIVCSPLLRAHQTAEIIAGELGIDVAMIQVIDELRERDFGELRGKHKEYPSGWYLATDTDGGIEPHAAIITRMELCLQELLPIVEANSTLVVGRASSGFYLQQVAEGHRTYTDFGEPVQLDNAGFITIDILD